MKSIHTLIFIFAAMVIGLAFPQTAYPQTPPVCNLGIDCQDDADCQDFANALIPGGGCPACIGCVNGTCQPSDTLCDDGDACTSDFCFFVDAPAPADPNGCEYFGLATMVPPDPNLPIECYLCEPTANGVTVDNGICDEAAGENCNNSPDCQEVGVPCGPPPPPNNGCQPSQATPEPLCQDGDRCTADICDIPNPTVGAAVCDNPPLGCEPLPDGCCPANCEGPNPNPQPGEEPCIDGNANPIPGCDADCWFPQSCGDGQVQPPETCDDTANQGDAGISPLGQVVSNETCRDQGTAGECTYCGDGLLQTEAGEECDLNQEGACGAGNCDLTTCLCDTNVCLTGSGFAWDEIRAGCADCRLNKNAAPAGFWKDYAPYLGLGFLLLVGLGYRRRREG